MKIIQLKDWEKNWSWQCTCRWYESKLEAEMTDLREEQSAGGSMHDFCPGYFWVACPVCKHRIVYNGNPLPKYVAKVAVEQTKRAGSGAT